MTPELKKNSLNCSLSEIQSVDEEHQSSALDLHALRKTPRKTKNEPLSGGLKYAWSPFRKHYHALMPTILNGSALKH